MSQGSVPSTGHLWQNMGEPGPSQHQASGYSRGQPAIMRQEIPNIQEQRHYAERRAQAAQEAAKMAEEAASLAGQAADMARRAAQLAAQASGLLLDGPSMPLVQEAFDMFPRQERSGFAPVPPQPPRQINQPMESYQSEFPTSEKSKRKRKSKVPAQEASGSGTASAIVPNVVIPNEEFHPNTLKDYQVQLMLLEQQKKRRLMMSQQQQGGEAGTSSRGVPLASFNPEIERPGPDQTPEEGD